MSVAQLLISAIGLGASISAVVLMRLPQHRREPYRGEPFWLAASLVVAVFVLALCLLFAWVQGRFESQDALSRFRNLRNRTAPTLHGDGWLAVRPGYHGVGGLPEFGSRPATTCWRTPAYQGRIITAWASTTTRS
jgi:hypothetical protein